VAGAHAADTGCWQLVVNFFLVQEQIFVLITDFVLPNYQKSRLLLSNTPNHKDF